MSDDLLNILSNSNKDIDNQKLMDYLAGKLSGEEKHEVEKWMADSEFEADAMEGLSAMNQPDKLNDHVSELNRKLQKQINERHRHRDRRRLKSQQWTLIAIGLILILGIVGYLLYRMKHKEEQAGPAPVNNTQVK
jgi:anti-sigma factor RsiW